MTASLPLEPSAGPRAPRRRILGSILGRPLWLAWGALLAAGAVVLHLGEARAPWAFSYPRDWQLPLQKSVSQVMDWLVNEADLGLFTFRELMRGVAWALERPYDLVTNLLSSGFMDGQGANAIQVVPPISWLAIVLLAALLGRLAKDWTLAAIVGGCFAYLAVFGQWSSAMLTLASIVIAMPIGAAGGLLIGILGYRHRRVEAALTPILDLMQTVPIFSYLVPILFLFGFGPVAAIVATVIYAMPPMVRITILALRAVPEEIVELGRMVGCTPRQQLWKVLIPAAKPSLMVGVNQVIMLSLNMVIIASMIGAGGLGYDVLTALRRLDIGGGLEAGVAIVVLAIALDRLSQAFANKDPGGLGQGPHKGRLGRHAYSIVAIAIVAASSVAGLVWGAVQSFPESWTVTTGPYWGALVEYLNVRFFDELDAMKTALLLNLLFPFKALLVGLPWALVVLALGLAGYGLGGHGLGGLRLATFCAGLGLFVAAVGLWQDAMVTLYLCGVSVAFACLIGMPIGILTAERERLWRLVQVLIDTLQTLPSFVYLIPVVMLFRVGDFSAMVAIVAYAIAPAVRYAGHGFRQVDPRLVEAGIAAGCTPFQLFWKIKLRLAFPELMLGLNQTIMLALSMLVITALVGTRDLGQEVYIALTKADTGRGIVSGLCVACIAMIADRLITAGAVNLKRRLGTA